MIENIQRINIVRITWKPEYAGPHHLFDGPRIFQKSRGTERAALGPSLLTVATSDTLS